MTTHQAHRLPCIPHSRPTLGKEEASASQRVLASGMLAMGKEVKEFELLMAGMTGLQSCKAVTNGTTALHLALLALGVKAGDEVVIPSFTCTALLNAVLLCGASPVIADIEEETLNLSFQAARKVLTSRTKAIILPHMFGMPAKDTEEFARSGIPLLEDCAQSLGAGLEGKMTGSFGEITVLSFYATKLLTTGEGGMVCSNNKKMINTIEDLREYDKKEEEYHLRFNAKMTDIQGAIGKEQLMKYPHFATKRREIATRYNEAFSSLNGLKPPETISGLEAVYYRYILSCNNPRKLIGTLNRQNICAGRPVPHPLHRVLKLPAENFPVTEKVWKESCSLPLYPSLTENEIKRITDAVRNSV